MGFNRIAKALALMAVVSMAASAQAADDRLTMFGYFRVSEGWQLSPNRDAQAYYGLSNSVGGSKFRLGNENDWAEFGWNMLAYKGEDGTIGHAVIMVGANYSALQLGQGDLAFSGWQGGCSLSTSNNGGSCGTAVFKQIYVDVQKIPGLLDSTLWIGKKYYKRYYSPINDMFVWSDDGFGAGIEDINFGNMKLSYALFDAGQFTAATPTTVTTVNPNGTTTTTAGNPFNVSFQGAFHDIRLNDITLMPGSHLDVGVGLAHKISERAEAHGGWQATARWTQDILGGNNQLFLEYGQGPCAAQQFGSNQAGGINLSRDPHLKKARIADVVGIAPTKEIGVDFLAMWEHNESGLDAAGTGAGSNWNSVEVGGRLSYHVASHASLLLEVGYDYVKAPGIDASTLLKITPAVELGTGYGNVPHIRIFATIANWNDEANVAASKSGIGAISNNMAPATAISLRNTDGTTATTAVSVGIQGEAWF